MRAVRRFAKRLAASFFGRRDDDRIREELETHLSLLIDEYVDAGLPFDDARRQARLRIGASAAMAEAFRDEQRMPWLDDLRRDLHVAFRSLRRYPLAASVAVASLAAGIGATTVTLTVRDVVFRKFPALYAEPQQLSWVHVGSGTSHPGRVPVDLDTTWAEARGQEMAASVPRGARAIRAGDRTSDRRACRHAANRRR